MASIGILEGIIILLEVIPKYGELVGGKMKAEIEWNNNRIWNLEWVCYIFSISMVIAFLIGMFFASFVIIESVVLRIFFSPIPLILVLFCVYIAYRDWFRMPLFVGLSDIGIHFRYEKKTNIIRWDEITDIKDCKSFFSFCRVIKKMVSNYLLPI